MFTPVELESACAVRVISAFLLSAAFEASLRAASKELMALVE